MRTRAIPGRSMAGDWTVMSPAAASQVRENMGRRYWGMLTARFLTSRLPRRQHRPEGPVRSIPKRASSASVGRGALSWVRAELR